MFVKVRQDGSINIPHELRKRFCIRPGAWYSVTANGKGKIFLQSQRCQCSLCGTPVTSVDSVTGTCSNCKYTLTKMVQDGMDLSCALKELQHRHYRGDI